MTQIHGDKIDAQCCATCAHWSRSERMAAVRILPLAVGCCTAMPPASDFRWPRTEGEHRCGLWAAVAQSLHAECSAGGGDLELLPVAKVRGGKKI